MEAWAQSPLVSISLEGLVREAGHAVSDPPQATACPATPCNPSGREILRLPQAAPAALSQEVYPEILT